MTFWNSWYNKQIRNRSLIEAAEKKATFIQITGFIIILIGITYLLYKKIFPINEIHAPVSGEIMATMFFIIILGISLAFPSLLSDQNKGLSTMRITVFMMTNVICMLLIKIGWNSNITSLSDIGLDWNWIGIIAFVFGAKAVQAFYENKPFLKEQKIDKNGPAEIFYSDTDIVNLAITQNQHYLYSKNNVRLIIHGKRFNDHGDLVDCVNIHLKDSNRSGIPNRLPVKINDSVVKYVETEIIDDVDKPSISYSAGSSVANLRSSDFKGSIACKLKLKNSIECILTCCHVMTSGSPVSLNGYFDNTRQSLINGLNDGEWFYGFRDNEFDIALIKNFNDQNFDYLNNLQLNGVREVTADDIKRTKITMIGRKDFYLDQNAIEGYIINHKSISPITIRYNDEDVSLLNLMVLSRTKEQNYQCISKPGDSGSIVVDSNLIAIGMIIAQNAKFTYAISLAKILRKLNAFLI